MSSLLWPCVPSFRLPVLPNSMSAVVSSPRVCVLFVVRVGDSQKQTGSRSGCRCSGVVLSVVEVKLIEGDEQRALWSIDVGAPALSSRSRQLVHAWAGGQGGACLEQCSECQ